MTLSPVQDWFDYPIIVSPHQTDYAGVVWHGAYIAWMEEARIDALRQVGIEFADLVTVGCDLPVIRLTLNYHKSLKMGDQARVRTRLDRLEKVRFQWSQKICAPDTEFCFVEGHITLVAVDRQSRRILRRFPPLLDAAVSQLSKST